MLDNTVLQHKFSCFLIKTIFICKKTLFFQKWPDKRRVNQFLFCIKKCYFCQEFAQINT